MKFCGKQLPKTLDCLDAGGFRKSSIGLKKLYCTKWVQKLSSTGKNMSGKVGGMTLLQYAR